jgi:hypothetical protein
MSEAAEEARREGARQLVILAAMLAAVPLLIWWERKMSGPDALAELAAPFRPRRRLARLPGEDLALRELHRDIARFEGKAL